MLRYRLEGSGSPLLLIHGWGVSYAIWQNLAPLLIPYYQLIIIELPGVGESPQAEPDKPYYQVCAEAIEDLRCSLGIERWSLLAYSSGTRAAEAYIQRYPQSIIRAIFLCPIYLQEIWSLFVRLLGTPHPQTLTQWFFSDWRLYNMIRALGFNWERHDYTYVWQHEIELQPLDILVRSLYEMPGQGRAPFQLSTVPTLFVWGRRDALTANPRHPRPNDVVIPANHSAPMLAASRVAEVVIPFLSEGRLVTVYEPRRRREKGVAREKVHRSLLRRRREQEQVRNTGQLGLAQPGVRNTGQLGLSASSHKKDVFPRRLRRNPLKRSTGDLRKPESIGVRLLHLRSKSETAGTPKEHTRLLLRMRQAERQRFARLRNQSRNKASKERKE